MSSVRPTSLSGHPLPRDRHVPAPGHALDGAGEAAELVGLAGLQVAGAQARGALELVLAERDPLDRRLDLRRQVERDAVHAGREVEVAAVAVDLVPLAGVVE